MFFSIDNIKIQLYSAICTCLIGLFSYFSYLLSDQVPNTVFNNLIVIINYIYKYHFLHSKARKTIIVNICLVFKKRKTMQSQKLQYKKQNQSAKNKLHGNNIVKGR